MTGYRVERMAKGITFPKIYKKKEVMESRDSPQPVGTRHIEENYFQTYYNSVKFKNNISRIPTMKI